MQPAVARKTPTTLSLLLMTKEVTDERVFRFVDGRRRFRSTHDQIRDALVLSQLSISALDRLNAHHDAR
jgi:hypothetical protein